MTSSSGEGKPLINSRFCACFKEVLKIEQSTNGDEQGEIFKNGAVSELLIKYIAIGNPTDADLESGNNSRFLKFQFWDQVNADHLPPGLDFAVFETAIRLTAAGAGRILQRALKIHPIDGVAGVSTIFAANNHKDRAQLIDRFFEIREAVERDLKSWSTRRALWTARRQRSKATALWMNDRGGGDKGLDEPDPVASVAAEETPAAGERKKFFDTKMKLLTGAIALMESAQLVAHEYVNTSPIVSLALTLATLSLVALVAKKTLS